MPLTRGTGVQSTGQLTWVIKQPQGFSHHIITFLSSFRSSSHFVNSENLQDVVKKKCIF